MADPGSSSSAAPALLASFTVFSKLPQELQEMIWEEAGDDDVIEVAFQRYAPSTNTSRSSGMAISYVRTKPLPTTQHQQRAPCRIHPYSSSNAKSKSPFRQSTTRQWFSDIFQPEEEYHLLWCGELLQSLVYVIRHRGRTVPRRHLAGFDDIQILGSFRDPAWTPFPPPALPVAPVGD